MPTNTSITTSYLTTVTSITYNSLTIFMYNKVWFKFKININKQYHWFEMKNDKCAGWLIFKQAQILCRMGKITNFVHALLQLWTHQFVMCSITYRYVILLQVTWLIILFMQLSHDTFNDTHDLITWLHKHDCLCQGWNDFGPSL